MSVNIIYFYLYNAQINGKCWPGGLDTLFAQYFPGIPDVYPSRCTLDCAHGVPGPGIPAAVTRHLPSAPRMLRSAPRKLRSAVQIFWSAPQKLYPAVQMSRSAAQKLYRAVQMLYLALRKLYRAAQMSFISVQMCIDAAQIFFFGGAGVFHISTGFMPIHVYTPWGAISTGIFGKSAAKITINRRKKNANCSKTN